MDSPKGETPKPIAAHASRSEHLGSLLDVVVSSKRIAVGNRPAIHLDLSEGFGAFAKLNETDFKQVVTNFLDNAVEALKGRENGMVEVSLSEDGANVVLSVQDNGCGISPENMKRLGEKGFTHGKAGGSGLGLHYSLARIRAWGGKLEIQSEPDTGTCLSVILPAEPTPEWFGRQIRIPRGARAVVLDDDPGIREAWRERLSQAGIPSVVLARAEQARVWLASELRAGDVLLFDQELLGEKLTGLDLLSGVSARERSYLVTSYFNDEAVIERCRKLGVRVAPKSAIDLMEISEAEGGELEPASVGLARDIRGAEMTSGGDLAQE